jgi:hypothetical protein
MALYVIKSWRINPAPLSLDDAHVEIHGRKSGLVGWFLSLLGIDPTVTFTITGRKIFFAEGSLAGRFTYNTLLVKTSSTFYGFAKPWKEAFSVFVSVGFILAVLMSALAESNHSSPVGGIAFAVLLTAVVSILYYYLNKRIILGYSDVGGTFHSISFKRSIIEGQKIGEKDAEKVISLIQTLIEAADSRR